MSTGATESKQARLAGWQVFTVRPTGEATDLLRRLRAAGATAANLPLLHLRGEPAHALAGRLRELRRVQRWLFVSPVAVRHAARIDAESSTGLFAANGMLAKAAAAGNVFAPGPGTAAALAQHGIVGARAPAHRFDSEGVLALPELAPPLSGAMVLVAAPDGRDLLARELTARGIRIEWLWVYRREPAPLLPVRLRALQEAPRPMLMLGSLALLRRLLDVVPQTTLHRLYQLAPLVLASDRLALAAREAGFQRVVVAASACPGDLLDAALCTAQQAA